jgi:hypothetical protein
MIVGLGVCTVRSPLELIPAQAGAGMTDPERRRIKFRMTVK